MLPFLLILIPLCNIITHLENPKSSVITEKIQKVQKAGRARSTIDLHLIVLHIVLVPQSPTLNIPAKLSLIILVSLLWMRLTLRDLPVQLVDCSEVKPLEISLI